MPNSTNAFIYNYQAGDEFVVKRESTDPPTYTNNKILSRTNFGVESIQYRLNTRFIPLDATIFVWKLIYSKLTFKYIPCKLKLHIKKENRTSAVILERKLKNLSKLRIVQFIEKYGETD